MSCNKNGIGSSYDSMVRVGGNGIFDAAEGLILVVIDIRTYWSEVQAIVLE